MFLRSLLCASAVVATGFGAANAATVTYIDAVPVPMMTPVPDSTTGTVNQGLTATVVNQYISSWKGTQYDGIGTYTSVQGGASATYLRDDMSRDVSFIWGTPDSYNTLAFYLDETLVDSITGSSIMTQENFGNFGAFVTITAESMFNSFAFLSSTNSFEYSMDVTPPSAVPVPAAGLLLLGGLAALVRRRKA